MKGGREREGVGPPSPSKRGGDSAERAAGSNVYRLAHALRVRWAEVDPQGIVFNPHYLAYFDAALTEYWRAIGCPYPQAFVDLGVDVFLVKAGIEYRAPARFDDVIEVRARVRRIGRSSLTFVFEIVRERTLLASGELVYVCGDPQGGGSLPVPGTLRDAIVRYECAPVEQG